MGKKAGLEEANMAIYVRNYEHFYQKSGYKYRKEENKNI